MRRRIALAAVLAAAAGSAALAMEGDGPKPAAATPEEEKAAREAEDAAAKLGRKVFTDPSIGAGERACVTCHENPKRPDLSLRGVSSRFPRWDADAGRVITIQEKFVQMQERSLKAKKTFPLGDARWTAVELHLRGLK